MEAFFNWVGAALGGLLVVAVVVAWWEHLVRSSRPPAPPEAAVPRVVTVDVQLDAVLDAAPAAPVAPGATLPSDAAQRRATLDGAMSRMVRAGYDGSTWAETNPMVLRADAEIPTPAATPAADGAASSNSTPIPDIAPRPARA